MSKLFDFNEIPIKFSVRLRFFFNLLKIWDTAGQEKYHALAKMYYKDA